MMSASQRRRLRSLALYLLYKIDRIPQPWPRPGLENSKFRAPICLATIIIAWVQISRARAGFSHLSAVCVADDHFQSRPRRDSLFLLVSILDRFATQLADIRWGYEAASTRQGTYLCKGVPAN